MTKTIDSTAQFFLDKYNVSEKFLNIARNTLLQLELLLREYDNNKELFNEIITVYTNEKYDPKTTDLNKVFNIQLPQNVISPLSNILINIYMDDDNANTLKKYKYVCEYLPDTVAFIQVKEYLREQIKIIEDSKSFYSLLKQHIEEQSKIITELKKHLEAMSFLCFYYFDSDSVV